MFGPVMICTALSGASVVSLGTKGSSVSDNSTTGWRPATISMPGPSSTSGRT
jgi:hypothetical protein